MIRLLTNSNARVQLLPVASILVLVIVQSANLAPINSNVTSTGTGASVPAISNNANRYEQDSMLTAANGNSGATAGGAAPGAAKNTNVYGGTGANAAGAKPNNRGYNQGYSYNTGIKPYTTGYTYYQPFGDAAKDQNNNTAQAAPVAAPVANHQQQQGQQPVQPPIPIELPNFFGGNQPQFGPVKMIPNQNVPLDENGIPNLDAIPLQNPQGQQGNGGMVQQMPIQQQNVQPINPNEFQMPNDLNLNNILAGPQPAPRPRPQPSPMGDFGMGDLGLGGNQNQNRNQNNGGGMFDFQPPNSNNFNFGQPNGGDSRDYNRMDNFAGNLNNFDTYLGDPSTELGNQGNQGNQGMDEFGLGGQQQVPSEIVNLNNAFGTDNNGNNNNNNMNDILGQLDGNGGGGGGGADPTNNGNIDLGSFGSPSTNSNQDVFSF